MELFNTHFDVFGVLAVSGQKTLAIESLINTRTLKKRCALAGRTEVKQTQEL